MLTTLPPTTNAPCLKGQWSHDGRYLALKREYRKGGGQGDLEVWDVNVPRLAHYMRGLDYAEASFDQQRPRILAGSRAGITTVVDLESGNAVARFKLAAAPTILALSPDGERFAAVCHPDAWLLSIHETWSGRQLFSRESPDQITFVDWHPSGQWIAISDLGGSISILDPVTGETRVLGRHKAQAVLASFSPDGGYVFSGGWEKELICWSLGKMERAFSIGLDTFHLQFRGDGRECALLTPGGLQLHSFELPAGGRELAGDLGGRVRRAAFSRDGRWLAASGQDRLGLWDLTSRAPAALVREGAAARIYFSPDGQELFASRAEGDGCFRWRIAPGSNAWAPPRLEPVALAVPEGFASLCLASNAMVITEARGSKLSPLNEPGPKEDVWHPTMNGLTVASADGRWLAVCRSFTSLLKIYRLPDFEPVTVLTNRELIGSFYFSPEADEIAVTARNTIEFWSTATWQRTREIPNYNGVLFPPTGDNLWLSRDYRTAGLFDPRTLKPLLPLPAGSLPLAISSDQRYLAVCVDARQLQLWDLPEVRSRLDELRIDWASAK